MRTYLDCVPCFVRQALDAARMTTDDEALQEEILRRVLRDASEMNMRLSPPAMGQRIHRLIRELTGNPDPYREVKERTNRLALDLYPEIQKRVREAADPLEMAVRMAIAGNIIDFGVPGRLHDEPLGRTMDRVATAPIHGDARAFADEAAAATSILYLADNAGEIVFDRVLIETLGPKRVTVVVRGGPILNDALRHDAEVAGLAGLVEIVENGSDAPGTIIEDCTEDLRSRFLAAGMVIAKGQGNYETLSSAPRYETLGHAPRYETLGHAPRPIWFILMAKCDVIARHVGCEPGSLVLRRR